LDQGVVLARFFYTVFLYLIMPLVMLRLLWRGRRAPAYRRRWGERFGFVPSIPEARRVIWVHSVSVGETLAAVPMIRRLQQAYPDALLAITTMTPTGSERVVAAFGDSVYHVYAPYDLPDALSRFLRRVHPDLLIIMETELWPNTIHSCARRAVPVVLANARLSEKSRNGYRRIGPLAAPMLTQLTRVAAQTSADAERFLSLGLTASQLQVTGNIKFDLELGASQRSAAALLATQWRGASHRPLWLVASTHRGEDEIVLDAFAQVVEEYPDTLLVLVPRHPERFDEVAELCRQRGHATVRRSTGVVPASTDQILLGDTMGELALFFGACDLAFVGGSLVPVGGHNLIEPAAWGVPVLSGPSLFNFSEVSGLLLAAKGMEICDSAPAIAASVKKLLGEPELRRAMGHAARSVADANRGAMDRLLGLIAGLLAQSPGKGQARR